MPPATDQQTGVTIFGQWVGAFGFASHTRNFSAALAKIEDVVAVPLDMRLTAPDIRLTALDMRLTAPDIRLTAPDIGLAAPDIRLTAPDIGLTAPRFRSRRADDRIGLGIGPIETMAYISGRYRIAFVVWETTVLPGESLRILREFDEVWVPSHWGRRILLCNGLPEDRVHVIPEGVDPSLFRPAGPPDARPREVTRPFRFLCVAKWEVRKGTADLALAFAREFKPDEPVELIFHGAVHGRDPAEALKELDLPPHAPIRVSKPVPFSSLPGLYSDCDVMVLPTKAEGWGLPILEALSCGIPVIATNYSAHTEFLNNSNGYLIDVADMIEVKDAAFYGWKEDLGVWAQPDPDHLQRLMRQSYEDDAERIRKGIQGRHDAVERWTWDHAARAAQKRLRFLSG